MRVVGEKPVSNLPSPLPSEIAGRCLVPGFPPGAKTTPRLWPDTSRHSLNHRNFFDARESFAGVLEATRESDRPTITQADIQYIVLDLYTRHELWGVTKPPHPCICSTLSNMRTTGHDVAHYQKQFQHRVYPAFTKSHPAIWETTPESHIQLSCVSRRCSSPGPTRDIKIAFIPVGSGT